MRLSGNGGVGCGGVCGHGGGGNGGGGGEVACAAQNSQSNFA